MVKEFLSQKGISFIEHDVSRDRAAAEEMVQKTGQMGVPVTIVDGQTIIGFNQPQIEQALSQSQASQRPSFGAAIADASKITAKMGTGIKSGAYIGSVKPGSVAERLNLKQGDIITELNKQTITSTDDLANALARLSQGSRLILVFLRGTETHSAEGVF
jgi:S1-C subfamily serine protease